MKKLVPRDAILIPDNAALAFHGQIFDVYQWPQSLSDGSVATFEMMRRSDTVKIIAVIEDRILLVQDEQPNQPAQWTLPGGRVEAGETILEAAQRELLEETGYSFANWKLVQVNQPVAKLEWFGYTFVADTVSGHGGQRLDAGENISIHILSYGKVRAMVLNGDGDLSYTRSLFSETTRAAGLLALPEFQGMEIDR